MKRRNEMRFIAVDISMCNMNGEWIFYAFIIISIFGFSEMINGLANRDLN